MEPLIDRKNEKRDKLRCVIYYIENHNMNDSRHQLRLSSYFLLTDLVSVVEVRLKLLIYHDAEATVGNIMECTFRL